MSSWMNAATEASTIDAVAIASTTMRTEPRSMSAPSGAMEASAQARATIANAAGAQAVTRGSADSGTVSVSRAAQVWAGIAPKRIATAIANARYARPQTTGWATRSL